MQNRLLDLSRRHKKLVVQAMDAAAGLMSGLAVLIIVGDVGLSTTSTWQYLLRALVANHGALRLSGVYQRVLRYGLGDTENFGTCAGRGDHFHGGCRAVILSGIDAQLIMASQVGVIIAISFMRVILVSLMHANLHWIADGDMVPVKLDVCFKVFWRRERNSIRSVMSTTIRKNRVHTSMG